ncbi:MAG: hydantoinase/oxoprolinase family protein [Blastocatellia bacterium]
MSGKAPHGGKKLIRLGVDTGGTFTDFVALISGREYAFKLPSTPQDPAQAIVAGVSHILKELVPDTNVGELEIVHGTTVATNALIERKGARTALVVTSGFEDVIEIGRQARPDLYNFAAIRPDPLVPRALRFGLSERIGPDGKIIDAADPRRVQQLAAKLGAAGVESVAISLLFSYANPVHERMLVQALQPYDISVSASHQILPEYREFERVSTVVINAYLTPRVGRYLGRLTEGLANLARREGTGNKRHEISLGIMQSSGGATSAETAAREPVRTIFSGPAGGIVAATTIARRVGESGIITFDMGGTSTDVALCTGDPRTTNEAWITGLPIGVPVLDIHTVGAGGGSIASLDPGGALRVGPASAGSDPGPACYGKGTLATVTDANLVLGRFGGAGLLGGKMQLDEKRAVGALEDLAAGISRISQRQVSRYEAALGVVRVVNAGMEAALRLVSVERGHDPRQFSLISFGGAGGLHAIALAAALGVPKVIIPCHPGAFSALGVLMADVTRDYSRTIMRRIAQAPGTEDDTVISGCFTALEKDAWNDLDSERVRPGSVRITRSLSIRYAGQSYEIDVAVRSRGNWKQALRGFHQAHQTRYGHSSPTQPVEIVSVRLRGIGLTEKTYKRPPKAKADYQPSAAGMAQIWLAPEPEIIPVFERESFRPGAALSGPALVREYGSTTLVMTGWRIRVDDHRNLILTKADD